MDEKTKIENKASHSGAVKELTTAAILLIPGCLLLLGALAAVKNPTLTIMLLHFRLELIGLGLFAMAIPLFWIAIRIGYPAYRVLIPFSEAQKARRKIRENKAQFFIDNPTMRGRPIGEIIEVYLKWAEENGVEGKVPRFYL